MSPTKVSKQSTGTPRTVGDGHYVFVMTAKIDIDRDRPRAYAYVTDRPDPRDVIRITKEDEVVEADSESVDMIHGDATLRM